jgi:hypothetical protein
MVLVGGSNITISGSSNGGSATFSIIGASGGGAGFSAGVSNIGNTAGNTGLTGSNLVLSGGNGVSLSQSTHANGATIGFSVNTSYRASNDAIGLNTAGTNVTWTVNSSGLSLNASGYAGTATAITGRASITLNSAGLSFNGSALAGTGTAVTGNASITLNSSGLSFNGSGLAGTATALTGAIAATVNSGGVSISVPATSSLVGTQGLSVSTNGSTIYAYPNPLSQWDNFGEITAAGTAQGNSLVSIQPLRFDWPVAFSNIAVPVSITVTTSANNSTAYIDVSVSGVMYTRNASTLSSLFSFSNSLTQTWTSNATGTVTGVPFLTATCAGTTLTPGMYYLALHVSTNNTATGGANTTALANTVSMIQAGVIGSAANLAKAWGAQTAASQGVYSGMGILSTGATRATIAISDYVVTGTRGVLAQYAVGLRNATFQ